MSIHDFREKSQKICDGETSEWNKNKVFNFPASEPKGKGSYDMPYQSSANAYKIAGSELFIPQTNGEVSDSLVQNWTQQAVECYMLSCNCKDCPILKNNYSFVCQMNKIVEQLLQTKGVPNPNDFLFD